MTAEKVSYPTTTHKAAKDKWRASMSITFAYPILTSRPVHFTPSPFSAAGVAGQKVWHEVFSVGQQNRV